MEPATVLEQRRLQPWTLYNGGWEHVLQQAGLLRRFPSIPAGLQEGFIVGYLNIHHVQFPPNSTTISLYNSSFDEIIKKELAKGRYISPFQSSPLSLIPKPGHPDKFRLVQNFSFPVKSSPCFPNPSINCTIDTALFPCTWGKFSTIFLLISRLPPGSQVATRDVAKAYQTILLHPSQWLAAVVCISDSLVCIDTCVAFGASPSCGMYSCIADVGGKSVPFWPLWMKNFISLDLYQMAHSPD